MATINIAYRVVQVPTGFVVYRKIEGHNEEAVGPSSTDGVGMIRSSRGECEYVINVQVSKDHENAQRLHVTVVHTLIGLSG